MAVLDTPMILEAPSDAATVLNLEQTARRKGTGLTPDALVGHWQLQRTWSRRGAAASPLATGMLRALGACLILQNAEYGLAITNLVSLGPIRLQFLGAAQLRGQRPLLMFSFTTMQLTVGSIQVMNKTIPPPKPTRQPFFALIGRGDEGGWLCARGRGGGLAVWTRDTPPSR